MKPNRNPTLIRLKWARRRAKRLGIYGKSWRLGDVTDVAATWRKYGWTPPVKKVA